MRKSLVFIFAFFVSLYVHSQTTCGDAQPFCAGGSSGITFPATIGEGDAPVGPDYGCLGSTPNAAWYYMQIGTSGSLDVLIEGQLANGNSGLDVDFICWGPFTTLTGACNNLTANNTVDCSYSGSYTETLNIPSGVVGQYYMVLITNFANQPQNIIFNQQSGTGNTDCSILQASSPTICAGTTATIVASNSQNLIAPNYSINPGGITNSTGSFAVSPSTTTHYTLYVTGLNTQSAVVTETAVSTVSVFPQPIFAPTYTQASCTNSVNAANMHLTFNPASPVPSYTTVWSGSNPSVTSPTQASASSLGAGPYTVVATAAGGCSAIATFTMDQQPAPAVFTLTPLGSNFSVTCAQPILVFYATNLNLTYNFDNGYSAPIVDTEAAVTYTNTGTFTVTGTNPVSGCTRTSTFVVVTNTVAPPVSVTPTFQTISCVTTATTVTASTTPTALNTSMVFDHNGLLTTTPGTTAIYTPAFGTTQVCAVNNANGCSSCKIFTVASNDAFPTLNVSSADNFTVGCGVGFNQAQVDLDSQGGGAGQVNYTIVSGPGPYNPGLVLQYTLTVPGTYTAIAKDPISQCETKVPFSIIANTVAPTIDIDAPTTVLSCATPSTVLTAITDNTHAGSTWSYPGNGGPASITSQSIAVNTNTTTTNPELATYTLTLRDNLNNCVSTKTIHIRQNVYTPSVSISGGTSNISASVTCGTQSITLNNNSHTGVPAASGFPTANVVSAIEWDAPPPQQPGFNTTTYKAYTIGTYTLHAMDQSNGCMAVGTFSILDGRLYPVLTATGGVLDCASGSATLLASTSNGTTNLAYSWQGSVLSGTGSTTGTQVVQSPGIYKVTVTNLINGCAASATTSALAGSLTAGFTPDQTSGYAPLTVNFTNNSISGLNNTNSITTVWSFGNGSQLTTTTNVSPTTVYNQPGTYTVTIYASKGTACQDTAVRYITVDIPSKLEIPNVFTPNGDNINDVFFLKASNLTEIHTMIYDRWGHKVYDLTSNTGNISWDGKNDSDGKDAAAGTYFYVIKATGKDGQTYDTKGTVSLYR